MTEKDRKYLSDIEIAIDLLTSILNAKQTVISHINDRGNF